MGYIKSILVAVFCVPFLYSYGQQCGNCDRRPSIATFDFDIKVPPPSANDTTHELWPEWKALYLLSGIVSSKLGSLNAGCVKLNIPPSFDVGDTTLLSVGGETFTN